ncbi:MAG: hypothetical protein O7J95_21385, partial [Planctomycetota bacterium]|nr:hypothetical protein [Planctomycetota bacterium]
AGLATEYWLLDEVHGSVSTVLLLVPALGALHLAHRAHRRKEGTTHPGVSSRASGPWVLGLVLLLFLLMSAFLASQRQAEVERQAAVTTQEALQEAKFRQTRREEEARREAGTRDGEGRPAPERPGERKDER